RQCGTISASLNTQKSSLDDEDKRLHEAGLKIQSEAAAIDIVRKGVNLHDSAQVDAFNKRIMANQRTISRYNDAVNQRNGKARKASDDVNVFNVLCANRPYSESDLATLPPDQQQAMRSGAQRIS